MEDVSFLEDDKIFDEIDWENLFDGFTDTGDIIDQPNTSPESLSYRFEEIEGLLMNDDDDDANNVALESNQLSINDFLDGVLVDSPPSSDGFVSGVESPADVNVVSEKVDDEEVRVSLPNSEEKEEEEENEMNVGGDHASDEVAEEDPDDPVSKKRRRQMRNRDAAVRSRERKKMFVKDLEVKSKYLEAECRRLGRMLQCLVAENQALRLNLQKGCAFGATSAMQESAVLLLESLLLGSLLWFLGIMCLFTLPPYKTRRNLVEKRAPEVVAPKSERGRLLSTLEKQGFEKSRRCKASRSRMRGPWSSSRWNLFSSVVA